MTPSLELAHHCAKIHQLYKTDEMERIRAISFALLDVMDMALEEGVINADSESLPAEYNEVLGPVYEFLGDPLP